MKRTALLVLACVLIASVLAGTGIAAGKNATGGTKWQQLVERVTVLEQDNATQQQQIDDLTARVQALEDRSGPASLQPPNPPSGFVVDQMQTHADGGFDASASSAFLPIGQQFVPQSNNLSAIYLLFAFGATESSFVDNLPVVPPNLVVNVREGSDFSGPIVATSAISLGEIASYPVFKTEWLGATFDPAVSSTPGQPYTFELQVSDGENVGFVLGLRRKLLP